MSVIKPEKITISEELTFDADLVWIFLHVITVSVSRIGTFNHEKLLYNFDKADRFCICYIYTFYVDKPL